VQAKIVATSLAPRLRFTLMKIIRPAAFRGVFRTDDDALAVYSEAAGIARVPPRAIAVPVDVDDLSALVRWASEVGVPLIPRGSGSSMPGGAIGDGVVVDVSRWAAIGDVDVDSRTIRVGPGAIRADVDRAARRRGLRFPVDPSSGAFCTIGGMTSTNAAGAHSMHFGAMRRWVRAIDCVFSDGTRGEVRRGAPPPEVDAIRRLTSVGGTLVEMDLRNPSRHPGVIKDSSGYGLADFAKSGEIVDLLVGSEGTLAFFVEIELDLIPVAAATSSVLGAFATLESAVKAATAARQAGAVACELLDRTFLDVAASGGAERQVPAETESALLAEVEADDARGAAVAAGAIEKIFRECGATTARVALDRTTETELWELRHAASPILARLDPNLRSMQFVEDGAFPPANLPAYVRGVRAILEANETRGVIFGHAGDAHVHVNPLVDVGHPDWRTRVRRILYDVVALTAELRGTLTGEHGDGRLRTPLLNHVWPADVRERFQAVKDAFDPVGILNPGVKIGLPRQRALGDIKYDPQLPSLPPKAKAVLARVERDRLYSEFRLALLDDV
jgi:FAD/FMN-containing dehydrogenase